MSETVEIKALNREKTGTRAARAVREQGLLPAVIYGHGEAVESVALDHHEVKVALAHGCRIMNVEFGGKTQQCLIKDVQYDYLASTPVHMDLTRVDVDEDVRVTVGIELRGTPKGVTHGGILDQHLAEVEVECVVSRIPDTLHPIVTDLEVGHSLLVKDLEVPEGVKIITDPGEHICTIHALHTHRAEEVEPEPEEDVAEPERIGRVRKDEDQGSSA